MTAIIPVERALNGVQFGIDAVPDVGGSDARSAS